MVASDENDPVVCFPDSAGYLVVYRLVVAWFLEPETTIAGDNEESVRILPTNTQLVNKCLKVSVNVSGDDDMLGLRIFDSLAHFSALLIWFSIISFT